MTSASSEPAHLVATNAYMKTPHGWRMVLHHVSVAPGPESWTRRAGAATARTITLGIVSKRPQAQVEAQFRDFVRYVELANKGARELHFADTGAMWRSKYDMPPDAFAKEVDRLWEQLKPLYVSLHAYVRWKLHEKYGDIVPARGPIPAHLLGNMWAQSWGNIYPLLAPTTGGRGYDLTQILKARNTDPKQMVHYGESFFTSLGFDELPSTFWERSMLTKPKDRDVVCHASAWHIDFQKDVRLKMCIQINEEDFNTHDLHIHILTENAV